MKCTCNVPNCIQDINVDVDGRMITVTTDIASKFIGIYVNDPTQLAVFIKQLQALYISFIKE